jgi:hypothetical protein
MKRFGVGLSLMGLTCALACGQATILAPQVVTRYAELVRGDTETEAQRKLLTELSDLHTKRAAEARQGNKAEQAVWEAEEAKQLQDKANALVANAAELKKEKLALEGTYKELGLSLLANTPAEVTSGYTSSEMAYMDKLEERIQKSDQEVAAIVENRKLYSQQILTNNVAEDINRLSILLDQSQREVRQLEHDKANLELKRLEFRALRRLGTR